MADELRLEIGGIARAHGIRGEVVIVTHDPDSTILERVQTIWVGGAPRKITGARGTHRGWLVQLDGVVTRNDAEALKGRQVEVDRAELELGEGDVLLHDLIGCECRLPDGTPWGTIVEVVHGSQQDRLVVHHGEIERELPLVDVFVTNIDLATRVVIVDPPDGLPENKVVRR